MKHLIFSDVHANYFGLIHVLDFASKQHISSLWCLGDLVGYHGYPNECVETIRQRQIPTVKGNHEALLLNEMGGFSRIAERAQHTLKVTRTILRPELQEFLKSLPFLRLLPRGELLLHANFWDLKQTINHPDKARKQFEEMKRRGIKRVFFGHTHRPEIFMADPELQEITRVDQFSDLTYVPLKKDWLYLINPGSVGVSRHGLPLAFLVYDDEQGSVAYQNITLTPAEQQELQARNRQVFGGITLQRIPAIAREKLRRWYYRLSK